MSRPPQTLPLRQQALHIWNAGVDAVRADRLLADVMAFHDNAIEIQDYVFPVSDGARVEVVGAGKAAAAMALGVAQAYQQRTRFSAPLGGWVNVPDRTQCEIPHFHVHVGRPAGVNEPTEQSIAGTHSILQRVAGLQQQDVCIALISGGGSALLAAPIAGVSLQDKLHTIRYLSSAGANIEQLNTVRKHISDVKGGGLAAACRAGTLLTVIISDVLGDPLDLIASGPTVRDSSRLEDAIQVLQQFDPDRRIPRAVYRALTHPPNANKTSFPAQTRYFVVANNAMAVDEAGIAAERLGFQHAMHCSPRSEGKAEEVGRQLAEMAIHMLDDEGPNCLITGGEPTVELAPPEIRGRGGRNQQLVLAAMQHIQQREDLSPQARRRIVILSGGTDGEDGPTDAAGAVWDAAVWDAYRNSELDLADALARNDAYHFFQKLNGLIISGPTRTNVCDLRVVVIGPEQR